jgi:BMFP domain-containing protein YqiC
LGSGFQQAGICRRVLTAVKPRSCTPRAGAYIYVIAPHNYFAADGLAKEHRPLGAAAVQEFRMTQTSNRLLDEFAKMMTDAAGVAQGMRREVETVFRSQAERFLGDMNVVQREEFDAVREMAAKARDENEVLRARIAALEAKAGGTSAPLAGAEPIKRGAAETGPAGTGSAG